MKMAFCPLVDHWIRRSQKGPKIRSILGHHLDRIKTEDIQGIISQEKELCWLQGMSLQDVTARGVLRKTLGLQ